MIRKMLSAAPAPGAEKAEGSAEVMAALAELYGSLNLGPEQAIKLISK